MTWPAAPSDPGRPSLEELPVQSGTRYPMLLDLATRTVSGPLDIRGDHSDVSRPSTT